MIIEKKNKQEIKKNKKYFYKIIRNKSRKKEIKNVNEWKSKI